MCGLSLLNRPCNPKRINPSLFLVSVFLLLFVFTYEADAATITTAGSGDYSSTTPNAPWPGGVVPDPIVDSIIVGSGHTLTLSDTRTVPTITISNGATNADATLVLASTARATANGAITLNGGLGTNYKAVFKINGGAELDMQSNTFSWGGPGWSGGYAKFYTENTSADNRAIIRGNGARMIAAGTISLTYVNWQYLTIIGFNSAAGLNASYGRFEFNVQNCRFIDSSSWSFGESGTATSLNTYFNNNDFRRITVRSGMPIANKSVVYSRANGTKTGVFEVAENTIDYGTIAIAGDNPTKVDGNIARDFTPSAGTITQTGSIGYLPALHPAFPMSTNSGIVTMENSGEFTGTSGTNTSWYRIEIETGGTTFKWIEDTSSPPTYGGTYTTGVPVSTDYVTLSKGVRIKFSSTSGMAGDSWTFFSNLSGGYNGGGAQNMTTDKSIYISDSYNSHGFKIGSLATNILSENWGAGGVDHTLLGTASSEINNSLFLGSGTAVNQNGQVYTGNRVIVKNNTISVNTNGYIGFVEENSFKTGRVKLTNNLLYTSAAGTSNIANMVNSTHREVDFTDYNAIYAPNGTIDKYVNMVIPAITDPVVAVGTPTKTLSNTGNYSGTDPATYTVTVDVGATTFTWSCNTGGGASGISIGSGGSWLALNNEVYVNWGTTGSVAAGDQWTFTASVLTSDPDANPITGGGLHDLSGTNPQFVDSARSIATYMTALKGAYDTPQLARRDFYLEAIKRNGLDYYGNPATYSSDYAPETVRQWVFSGFIPQNSELQGMGEDGTDIGAMAVEIPDITPPTLSFTENVAQGPLQSDTIIAHWGDATIRKWDYDSDSTCSADVNDYTKTDADSMSQTDETNNGKYICLYGEDDAGNKTTLSSANDINVDTTAPNTTITSNPDATITNATAIFQFSGTETATFQCKLDSGNFASCTSPKQYTNLQAGQHKFEVKAIDTATNEDQTPASHVWTIDQQEPTSEPIPTQISIPNPKLYLGSSRKSFSTTLKSSKVKLKSTTPEIANGSVVVKRGSKTIATIPVDANGNWSQAIEANKFTLEYKNDQGQTVYTSKEYKLKVDSEKPKIKTLAPLYIKHRGSKIDFDASDNESIKYYRIRIGGKIIKKTKSEFIVPSYAPKGPQKFTIWAYDKAGNKASKSWNLIVTW